MNSFNLVSSFAPAGDQPLAIEAIVQGVNKGQNCHGNGGSGGSACDVCGPSGIGGGGGVYGKGIFSVTSGTFYTVIVGNGGSGGSGGRGCDCCNHYGSGGVNGGSGKVIIYY